MWYLFIFLQLIDQVPVRRPSVTSVISLGPSDQGSGSRELIVTSTILTKGETLPSWKFYVSCLQIFILNSLNENYNLV